jgi:hypothetical protein
MEFTPSVRYGHAAFCAKNKPPNIKMRGLGRLQGTESRSMSTNATTVGVVDGHTRFSPYGYTPSAVDNIAFLSTFSYRLS